MNTKYKLGFLGLLASIAIIAGVMAIQIPAATNENIGDNSGSDVNIHYKGHVDVYKIPASTGIPELVVSKDNLLVTNGKTYIRTQIGSGSATGSSSARNISLSNNATAPDAAWLDIPDEITANNMGRAAGTYAENGTGAWNVTYLWTANGAQSAQLTGLSYGGTPADNTLFAALQFASVTLAANDQLRVIWSISVS